jgi:hypothetical protein
MSRSADGSAPLANSSSSRCLCCSCRCRRSCHAWVSVSSVDWAYIPKPHLSSPTNRQPDGSVAMGARQWMSPLSRFSRQSERTPAQIGQLRLRLLNPPRKVISLPSAAIGQNRTATSLWIGQKVLSAALSGGLDEVSALWRGRDARLEFDSQSLICGERRLQ